MEYLRSHARKLVWTPLPVLLIDHSAHTPDLGRHEIKTHLHPLHLDASGDNYLLDSFLFKVVRARDVFLTMLRPVRKNKDSFRRIEDS